MKLDKNYLTDKYNKIEGINEVCNLLILKEIIFIILKIDSTDINFEKSKFEEKDETYSINLISQNNTCCNIYIDILANCIVDIQIGYGGEYLYLQEIIDWSHVKKLRDALKDIFYYPIDEEIIYSGNKIIRSNYTVYHHFGSKIESYTGLSAIK